MGAQPPAMRVVVRVICRCAWALAAGPLLTYSLTEAAAPSCGPQADGPRARRHPISALQDYEVTAATVGQRKATVVTRSMFGNTLWVYNMALKEGDDGAFDKFTQRIIALTKEERGVQIYEFVIAAEGNATTFRILLRLEDPAEVLTHEWNMMKASNKLKRACEPEKERQCNVTKNVFYGAEIPNQFSFWNTTRPNWFEKMGGSKGDNGVMCSVNRPVENVYWLLDAKLINGDRVAFGQLLEMIVTLAKNVPGVLEFEFYLGNDGQSLRVLQRFASAQLGMDMENKFHETVLTVPTLAPALDLTERIAYGISEAEAKNFTGNMASTFVSQMGGFRCRYLNDNQ